MRRHVASWLLVALGLGCAAALGWAVVTVPDRSFPPLSAQEEQALPDSQSRLTVADNRAKLRNDMRTSMLQGLTALAVAGGLVFSYRTLRMNREGQVTERFTKAIDQIGQQDKPEVVLGGIYSLARIAHESRADQRAVVDVLTAHVRRLASYPPPAGGLPRTTAVDNIPSYRERLPTVHVALATIAGLERVSAGADLRDTDLRGADLHGADLRGWQLGGAQLAAADLRDADLRRADLRGADLTGATLADARLEQVVSDDRTRWPTGYQPPLPRRPGHPANTP